MQLVNYAILNFVSLVTRFRSERGQDLLEYAMLGGLIAFALAALAIVFNGAITSLATGIAYCVDFDPGTICTGGI